MKTVYYINLWLIFWVQNLFLYPYSVFPQDVPSVESLKKRLIEINQIIQDEGKRNNFHLVEKNMDAMLELMPQVGIPAEQIRQRAHLRIRYSLSVNRLSSAREAALSWLQDHPQDKVVREYLGIITLRMDRNAEARAAFNMLYDVEPGNPHYQLNYLHVLNLLDDREEGLKLCAKILQKPCENPKLLREIIDSYLRFNQNQQAIALIDQLQNLTPEDSYPWYARGKVWMELGDNDKAIDSLSKVTRTSSQWPDAKQLWGLCLSRQRQFEQAAHQYVEILSTYPYDTKTMSLLEQTLARLRKRQGMKQVQSIRQETEKIAMPDVEATYMWRNGDIVEHARLRSISLSNIGQFHDAETMLLNACRSVPESTSAYRNLGRFYITTHQACRAEPIFKKLLHQVPVSDQARLVLDLAESYLRQGKTKETEQLVQTHAATPPLQQSLQSMMGSFFLEIVGDASQAISYLNTLENQTTDETAILAQAYLQQGELKKALQYFNHLPDDYPQAKPLLAKVECLARLNRKKSAETLYQTIIRGYPELQEISTIFARAALAEMNQSEKSHELRKEAETIRCALKNIQPKVMEAHRVGWPKSVPVLLELSDIYLSIHNRDIALQYAQLAYEGDRNRWQIRTKMIDLMTDAKFVFRRLSQIRIVQTQAGNTRNFDDEIRQALSHIQLTPRI